MNHFHSYYCDERILGPGTCVLVVSSEGEKIEFGNYVFFLVKKKKRCAILFRPENSVPQIPRQYACQSRFEYLASTQSELL